MVGGCYGGGHRRGGLASPIPGCGVLWGVGVILKRRKKQYWGGSTRLWEGFWGTLGERGLSRCNSWSSTTPTTILSPVAPIPTCLFCPGRAGVGAKRASVSLSLFPPGCAHHLWFSLSASLPPIGLEGGARGGGPSSRAVYLQPRR